MGHADLRIRERTMPAVADRAYELLRKRTTLAEFVQEELKAMHAGAADRAALDLEDRDAPARLVVTRDGHAVTCLAAGMVTDAPIIRWPQAHAYLEAQKLVLRAHKALHLAEDEDGADALSRVYTHPHRVTRAEFDTLVVLGPLLVKPLEELLKGIPDAWNQLLSRPRWNLDHPLQYNVVDACRRMFDATSLLLVATQDEPLAELLPLTAVDREDTTVSRTGWWLLMNRPRWAMDQLKKAADAENNLRTRLVMARALNNLAVRYPWLEAEAFEAGRDLVPENKAGRLSREDFRDLAAFQRCELRARLLQALDICLFTLLPEAPPPPAATARAVLESVELGTMEMEEAAACLGPAHAELLRAWRPLDGLEAEPRRHPLPPDRVASADEVKADTWRRVWMSMPVALDVRADAWSVAFSLAPPEAVVPDDRHRLLRSVRDRLQILVNVELNSLRKARGPLEGEPPAGQPVRVEQKPGPNAPCSCGSGKKYKKCCGAA